MKRRSFGGRRAAGFTLIEVMVAVLVMGVGLLGFALLQTMSVRFTQSANYRTQATSLAYEMLDQMRVNRIMAVGYVGDYEASTTAADCEPATGDSLAADEFRQAWECRLGKALGADASATVASAGERYTVTVTWGDERWNDDADPRSFSATTEL